MRRYINVTFDNEQRVYESLAKMISKDTSVEEYRNAFYNVGLELGALIRRDFERIPDNMIMLSLASEDADWLGRGVLCGMGKPNVRVSAFWNDRFYLEGKQKRIAVAPIIKSYEEPVDGCQYLIIVKSIINTSCVVKTQLTRMIGKFNPERIFILSPVAYIDAESSLKKEFPESISRKFSFHCFAVDDERDHDIVLPGIGGSVYSRLGLGDATQKNTYMPDLVMERIMSSVSIIGRNHWDESLAFQQSST